MNRTSQTSLQAVRSRLFYVDAARALAIVMVTVYHLWRYFGLHELNVGPVAVHKLAAFGYTGVDLFFAVSGFAMMMTWTSRSQKSEHPVASFYTARAGRIVPPYIVAVTFFAALSATGVFQFAHGTRDILTHLTFTHTLFPTTFFSVAGVFWSLAVEVQFYLLFPLLVGLSGRAMVAVMFASTALALVLDHWAPHSGPMRFVLRWNVIGFAPLFILGILIQRYRSALKPCAWRSKLCAIAAIIVMLSLPADSTDLYSRLAIGALLATSLLLFAPDREPRFGDKAISHVALASYSIYLYNYIFTITPAPLLSGWLGAVTYFAGIFCVGGLAWLMVERPFEWLRHRGRRRLRQLAVNDVPST